VDAIGILRVLDVQITLNMKQRITYLVPEPDDFRPELLTVQDESLSVRNLKAAKEHRVTFGLSELPEEVRQVAYSKIYLFNS
jgi:hypothetical protein